MKRTSPQRWKALDAHLKKFAPTLHEKLPADYLVTLQTFNRVFIKVSYMAAFVVPDRMSEAFVDTVHGLLRVVSGLGWEVQGIPPIARDKRITRCGATHFKRVEGYAKQLYVLVDHLKTRDPVLWRYAMMGWNGNVALNSSVPGLATRKPAVFGYVSYANEIIAHCIFVSPIPVFGKRNTLAAAQVAGGQGTQDASDLVTMLHELAHLTAFTYRMDVDQPTPYTNPHDDPFWLDHFNRYLRYASEDLGWTLYAAPDVAQATGLRYGITCARCLS